jgi:thiol-disulfide isomerase/thioredoxin
VNDELFKYVVNYVTFKWESGKEKRMCWDKVFHHMATNYYMKGECTWTDSVQLAKIESRAKDLTYVLCGNNPINLHMKYYPTPGLYDTSGTLHELYKVKADYIIMWFWDSDCGHCKKQTPKLWDMYNKYKEKGLSIEVYAINVEQESKGYKEYLKENKYTWINVQDTGNFSAFRKYYDIYSTPVAYILNKERKLIGKRLDPEAIDTFLEQYVKEEEESKIK